MKRSPIRRKSWIKRGTKKLRNKVQKGLRGRAPQKPRLARNSSLKKVNVARQAKRRERYRKGLAAYRKSECYKEVEARSGGRCEWTAHIVSVHGVTVQRTPRFRCFDNRDEGHRLTHHHLTYRRFGGAERPADIIVLCDRHNAEAEAKHPTRWHQRKSA